MAKKLRRVVRRRGPPRKSRQLLFGNRVHALQPAPVRVPAIHHHPVAPVAAPALRFVNHQQPIQLFEVTPNAPINLNNYATVPAPLPVAAAPVPAPVPVAPAPVAPVIPQQPIVDVRAQPVQFAPAPIAPARAIPAAAVEKPIAIMSSVYNAPGQNVNSLNSWDYAFVAENGIKQNAVGEMKSIGDDEVVVMRGSYEYIGADGLTYVVNWEADEKGFRADAPHLPKPVAIPFPEVQAAVDAQLRFAATEVTPLASAYY